MSRVTLLTENDIENLKSYKFISNDKIRKKVDKSNVAHQKIVNDIPIMLFNELKENKMNLSDTEIRGSVGEGLMSEVYWIAILNENFVPRNQANKLTTQRGIYVVLLFDRELNFAYLAIGNGAEYMTGSELRNMSKNQMKLIKDHVNHQGYILNSEFKLYLGRGTRPKNYVKGIPIYKAYPIDQIYLDELIVDIMNLQEILETVVLEKGVDEIEIESSKNNTRKRKYTSISVEKYERLRKMQEKRNKEIGNLAEEFVFKLERERVLKWNPSLVESVGWKSKYFDGLGYDIESLFKDRSKKYIEIKGTSLDTDEVTFYLSKNELKKSKELGDHYVLVLVSNVGNNKIPRIVDEIVNPADKVFEKLEPILYKGIYKK